MYYLNDINDKRIDTILLQSEIGNDPSVANN
jgi:hypothetical protein